jgi:hypothetical protein
MCRQINCRHSRRETRFTQSSITELWKRNHRSPVPKSERVSIPLLGHVMMAKNRFRQVSAHGKSRPSFVVEKSGSARMQMKAQCLRKRSKG